MQLETRCTHNKVHFVLKDEQRQDPFWRHPTTLELLGKSPKFIPKAGKLRPLEVLGACARLQFRMVRAFERFVRRRGRQDMETARQEAGIQPWMPKQSSLTVEQCRMHVQRFFKYAEENGAWRGNEFISPLFQTHLRTMERDILMAAAKAKKQIGRAHV